MNMRRSCDSLWRKRLDALAAVWPEVLRGDVKALHKARIASRRIREALPIIAAGARPSKVKKLNRKVREITRQLGPVRELDVKLAMIEKDDTSGSPHRRALAMVRREVASRRRDLREDLTEAHVADLDKLIKRLNRICESGGARHGRESGAWRIGLAARMLRRAKQLKSAVENTGPLYVPEPIHAVRIATKKLRYVLEFAADAGFAPARDPMKSLKRQQERLGRLQDLQSLLHHVREAAGSSENGARLGDVAAYAESIEQESRRLHAEYVGQREALLKLTLDVRERLVPALTTQRLKPARVVSAHKRAGGHFRAG